MQTRLGSFVESWVNVAIGYGVAVASQMVIFPLYDIHIPVYQNFTMGLWFTVVSVVRSYAVRRLFNRMGWFSYKEKNK